MHGGWNSGGHTKGTQGVRASCHVREGVWLVPTERADSIVPLHSGAGAHNVGGTAYGEQRGARPGPRETRHDGGDRRGIVRGAQLASEARNQKLVGRADEEARMGGGVRGSLSPATFRERGASRTF